MLAAEVKVGALCPACHGRSASHKQGRYLCGCGYSWEVSRDPISRATLHMAAMLQQVAGSGELPDAPAKITRDGDR